MASQLHISKPLQDAQFAISDLEATVGSLQGAQSVAQGEIARLRSEVNNAHQKIDDLKKTVATQQTSIIKMALLVNKLRSTMHTLEKLRESSNSAVFSGPCGAIPKPVGDIDTDPQADVAPVTANVIDTVPQAEVLAADHARSGSLLRPRDSTAAAGTLREHPLFMCVPKTQPPPRPSKAKNRAAVAPY